MGLYLRNGGVGRSCITPRMLIRFGERRANKGERAFPKGGEALFMQFPIPIYVWLHLRPVDRTDAGAVKYLKRKGVH